MEKKMETLIFKAILFFVFIIAILGIGSILSIALDAFINFWTSGEWNMKYPKHIRFNWFTIMGGVGAALFYIQHNQHVCLNDKRFEQLVTIATGA